MRRHFSLLPIYAAFQTVAVAEPERPYRLESVDLKQRVIWSGMRLGAAEPGLAFGGQDQDAEDGRPHTRVRTGAKWRAIGEQLRADNPLQTYRERTWALRDEAKDLRAKLRNIYFRGLPQAKELAALQAEIAGENAMAERFVKLVSDLQSPYQNGDNYTRGQASIAITYLQSGAIMIHEAFYAAVQTKILSAGTLKAMREAQVKIELAAEALDAEPAARSVDCGRQRGDEAVAGAAAKGLVYDPTTKLYVLFGGDHLDYLTNDTWVFDPAKSKWFQRHPEGAPPPRGNHLMQSIGEGRVQLTGGYTYASNTDYVGGQYVDLDDEPWFYDIAKNSWSGGKLQPIDSRTYRSGPFHPDFYLQGEKPDAADFVAKLKALPVNEWVTTDPPYRPRMNRDWGMAVIDPDRDMMLRWSGGHSAHGGTDVPHYHFATNRWELPFPVEFPLGQLYSNTSYPNGFNYNRRPWMTGHTYQNYQYDPISKLMVKAGRPRHHYLYDPDVGDWVGRGAKPKAMRYTSCFYTLTLVSTPRGVLCWDKNGRVHRFDHDAENGGKWSELELVGAELPGAVVDNSTIAYDSKRDRVLVVSKPYGKAPFSGQVWAIDLKTRKVEALSPAGMEHAHRFAYIDRCVYDPESDLVLMASYLNGAEQAVTPTPAYDCAKKRWVTLELKYTTGKRGARTTRAFPHGRSCGIMFDPKRRLIWGTDTNSQIYVLRLDLAKARMRPL